MLLLFASSAAAACLLLLSASSAAAACLPTLLLAGTVPASVPAFRSEMVAVPRPAGVKQSWSPAATPRACSGGRSPDRHFPFGLKAKLQLNCLQEQVGLAGWASPRVQLRHLSPAYHQAQARVQRWLTRPVCCQAQQLMARMPCSPATTGQDEGHLTRRASKDSLGVACCRQAREQQCTSTTCDDARRMACIGKQC